MRNVLMIGLALAAVTIGAQLGSMLLGGLFSAPAAPRTTA